MSQAYYDDIAEWYNNYLSENPIYQEIVLPTLLELIGNVQDQTLCDLACGQGWITRELARAGAQITGFDLSEGLLNIARRYEEQKPLGISYLQSDAQHAEQFPASTFDGCVCMFSLVDIPDLSAVFQTIAHLLKPGGWLVFTITHPCFELPQAQWITLEDGSVARAVKGYFQEGFWKSESGGIRSRVGSQHRMLSTYLNTLLVNDFSLERILEPQASNERTRLVTGNREVPSLLFIRAHLVEK